MANRQSPQNQVTARLHALPVTFFALGLRLLVVVLTIRHISAPWFFSQASELGQLANSLASGHGLSSPFGADTGPSAFLAPGYPLLVAVLFKLFGAYSLQAAAALMVMQAFFGAATVFALMHLARRVFDTKTANIAGAVCAVHPWLISLSIVFWETSFSVMMMTVLVWLALLWTEKPTLRVGLVCAAAAALAISVNPSLALTCIALFGWCAYKQRHSGVSRLLGPAALFLVLSSIWPARNARVMHAFIPLRDNLGYELWQGNRPGADGFFLEALHPNKNQAELAHFKALGELGYMKQKAKIARAAISSDPGRFLTLTAKRVICFWAGAGRNHAIGQMLISITTSALSLLGLLMLMRRRGLWAATPLAIPLLIFPLPYYITHPDFRFWCVLAPLLTAFGISVFVRERHSRT